MLWLVGHADHVAAASSSFQVDSSWEVFPILSPLSSPNSWLAGEGATEAWRYGNGLSAVR